MDLENEQPQASIALHRTPLHERHDLSPASEHRSTCQAVPSFEDVWTGCPLHHPSAIPAKPAPSLQYCPQTLCSSSLLRRGQLSLKYYILFFVPSLAYITIASAVSNRPSLSLEPRQIAAASSVSDDGGLSWLWYPTIVVGILIGEFSAAHILGDPLLLHGVSMGISAGAYLLMVFNQHRVPFHVQFSVWCMCAILTIAWTYYDTLSLRSEMRRPAVLAIIVVGFLLDSGISCVLASAGNPVFAANDPPSIAFMFATFLLPCTTMSAFLCNGILGLYRQVGQRWTSTNTAHLQTGERLGAQHFQTRQE